MLGRLRTTTERIEYGTNLCCGGEKVGRETQEAESWVPRPLTHQELQLSYSRKYSYLPRSALSGIFIGRWSCQFSISKIRSLCSKKLVRSRRVVDHVAERICGILLDACSSIRDHVLDSAGLGLKTRRCDNHIEAARRFQAFRSVCSKYTRPDIWSHCTASKQDLRI